jgi:ribose transport system ATP-binding protein
LFTIIKGLRENNVTVIYISHRLDEIFELGDYVTVMRDGKHIETKPVSQIQDRSELIKMMIGKTVFEQYTPREGERPDTILQVKNVSNHRLNDISFDIHAGEIAGFYGLVGAGKTELARAIFGADQYEGDIIFKGKQLKAAPDKAIAAGITLVPEERRTQGLFTILTIRGNVPVMNMAKISRAGFINDTTERNVTLEYVDKLKIATNSIEKEAAKLSGGNQQKVVLAKWLEANAEVVIFDEPTRGIDVGAKYEIHLLINRLAAQGKAIIMISSELPEVLGMSDRILVMQEGRISGEIRDVAGATQEQLLALAMPQGGQEEVR